MRYDTVSIHVSVCQASNDVNESFIVYGMGNAERAEYDFCEKYSYEANVRKQSVIILNKNTKGAKKGKANQKQQLSTKKFDITRRQRSLEYKDIMLTMVIAS